MEWSRGGKEEEGKRRGGEEKRRGREEEGKRRGGEELRGQKRRIRV